MMLMVQKPPGAQRGEGTADSLKGAICQPLSSQLGGGPGLGGTQPLCPGHAGQGCWLVPVVVREESVQEQGLVGRGVREGPDLG